MVTEYVEGGTLKELIERGGPLHGQTAALLMGQMVSAIAYAHRQGILHRDIKPANILLSKAGTVKVTDFGLAKIQAPHAPNLTATKTTFTAGTLRYMSPEQLEGLSKVDQRGDIYALGMTFYEMLAGRTPFDELSSDFAIQKAIYTHDFPSLDQLNKEVPDPLVRIVMKAIERDPADRYPTAKAMLAALEGWQERTEGQATDNERVASRVRLFAPAFPPSPRARPRGWLPDVNAIKAALRHVRRGTAPEQRRTTLREQRPASRRSTRAKRGADGQRGVPILPARRGPFHMAALAGGVLVLSLLFFLNGSRAFESSLISGSDLRPSQPGIGLENAPQINASVAAPLLIAGDLDQPPPTPSTTVALTEGGGLEGKTEATPAALPPPEAARADRESEPPTSSSASSDRPAVEARGFDAAERGVATASNSVTVASPQEEALTLPTGTIRLKPIPWGNVYVDGEPLAYEIDYWYALNLPARHHRITVRNPVLGRTWEMDVIPVPGDTQDVTIDFMARVEVNVAAKDTGGHHIAGEIYVDGNPTGDWSPRKIRVYPGLHRIEVRAAGYAQFEVREVTGAGASPVDNPVPFNQDTQARIFHVILEKRED